MEVIIRKAGNGDYSAMAEIWNEVVAADNAFPQTAPLAENEAAGFFAGQTYCGAAEKDGKILGLYILHPNNTGHCGHICNASYAVSSAARGLHIGEALVKDSLLKGKEQGFGILQFNAVVKSNACAIHLYDKLGFVKIGTVPGGYIHNDGTPEDIELFYHVL